MMDRQELQKILQHGVTYGHLYNPRHPELKELFDQDLTKLNEKHRLSKALVQSVQEVDPVLEEIARHVHHRAIRIDGEPGPATLALTDVPRCGTPDFGPESGPFLFDDNKLATPDGELIDLDQAIMEYGNGNWRGCHGAEGFHRAIVRVNNAIPQHLLRPYEGGRILDAFYALVHKAYAALGLDWIHEFHGNYSARNHQSTSDYGNYAGGWIGLAIVSNNSTCASGAIWARYKSSYASTSSGLFVVQRWADLDAHEKGHNCGVGHTNVRPSVMGPSGGGGDLIYKRGWVGDPVESQLKARFGGKPIPASDFPGWGFDKWA